MGRLYVFVCNGRVVGYVVLAMDHLNEEQGRLMAGWASAYAKFMSGMAGCRVVLVKSEPDVVGFYEKLGFKKAKAGADLTDVYLDMKHLRQRAGA